MAVSRSLWLGMLLILGACGGLELPAASGVPGEGDGAKRGSPTDVERARADVHDASLVPSENQELSFEEPSYAEPRCGDGSQPGTMNTPQELANGQANQGC